jgi:GNAT superfamily N-acetyltransferase
LDDEIGYWLEMAEVRVLEEVYGLATAQPGNLVGAELSEVGGGVATALTAVDIGFFNRTIGLGIEQPVTAADLDAVVAFYDRLGRSTSVVQVAPQARPPGATEWLAARGFAAGRRWAKLWRPVGEPLEAATSLRIEPDVGQAQRPAFERVLTAAFEFPPIIAPMASAPIGRPGWTHFIGYDGDEAVAASAMFVDRVAWFGYGSTLEAYRGRGGQSAMFAARLRRAAELGCRFAVTETGEETPDEPNPSYRNMKRLGFRDAYLRQNWIRATAAV